MVMRKSGVKSSMAMIDHLAVHSCCISPRLQQNAKRSQALLAWKQCAMLSFPVCNQAEFGIKTIEPSTGDSKVGCELLCKVQCAVIGMPSVQLQCQTPS